MVLEAEGHDVVWVSDWPEDPGDDKILEYAYQEGRILVTLDKDFGELAIVFNRPHSVGISWHFGYRHYGSQPT